MTIGLIAHAGKEGSGHLVRLVTGELKRRNAPYLLEQATAALIGETSRLDEKELTRRCDLRLVMGGDGSILRALHRGGETIRPIFGINIDPWDSLPASDPTNISRPWTAYLQGIIS